MKIYILPVPNYLQPPTQRLMWPPDCDDYGVEQDFLRWLEGQPGLLTDDAKAADWHYLPAFWNRWYLTNEPRKTNPALQSHLDETVAQPHKTFTICEYDPFGLQPGVDLYGILVFSANRMTSVPVDIPLLLNPHELTDTHIVENRAVFIGHLGTHPIRRRMKAALADCPGCLVTDEPRPITDFVRELQASLVALCPRGDGAQSFRFYEAMQAGVCPLYLSDFDARPFRAYIDWDAISLYREDTEDLCDYLLHLDTNELLTMGELASEVYHNQLAYGKWCGYVIMELERYA